VSGIKLVSHIHKYYDVMHVHTFKCYKYTENDSFVHCKNEYD